MLREDRASQRIQKTAQAEQRERELVGGPKTPKSQSLADRLKPLNTLNRLMKSSEVRCGE